MGRRKGGKGFIETHTRSAPGTGAKVSVPAVHVPSILTASKHPLTEKEVAQSDRYGEGFIEATPYGTYPSPRDPVTGASLPQDSPAEEGGHHPSQEGLGPSKGQPEALDGSTPSLDDQDGDDADPDSDGDNAYLMEEGSVSSPKSRKGAMTTGNGRPFQKGNQAAIAKKPRLVMLGIPLDALEADPRMVSYLRKAEYYLKRRTRELCAMFGYVSAGVNGILSSAALQLAHSKFINVKAIESGFDLDPGDSKKGQYMRYMAMSQTLQNAARSNELAASDLCAKEAGLSKTQANKAAAWLKAGGGIE